MKTKHENFFRNFISNFTAYEISYLIENCLILLSLNIFKDYIPEKMLISKLFIIFFTVMLIILVIVNNFLKLNQKSRIKLSYTIQKDFILRGNYFKSLFLELSFFNLNLRGIISLKIFLIFTIIFWLLQVANQKYYNSLILLKKEVLDYESL